MRGKDAVALDSAGRAKNTVSNGAIPIVTTVKIVYSSLGLRPSPALVQKRIPARTRTGAVEKQNAPKTSFSIALSLMAAIDRPETYPERLQRCAKCAHS